MDDKIKGQLLQELSQTLSTGKGLYSQIIDFFPYPIAIITPDHRVTMVNKAFAAETKTRSEAWETGNSRILQYNIRDIRIAAAVRNVFEGVNFYYEDAKDAFSMFSGIPKQSYPPPDRYREVLIFPVPAENKTITHGVIVFMP